MRIDAIEQSTNLDHRYFRLLEDTKYTELTCCFNPEDLVLSKLFFDLQLVFSLGFYAQI